MDFDYRDIISSIQAQFAKIALPSWPVWCLSEASSEGWLSGIATGPDGLRAVRIDYGNPDAASRVILQTQPAHRSPLDLAATLKGFITGNDDGEPLRLSRIGDTSIDNPTSRVSLIVGSQETSAATLRSGRTRLTCADIDGTLLVVITVLRDDTAEVALKVEPIQDLEPFKVRRAEIVQSVVEKRGRGNTIV